MDAVKSISTREPISVEPRGVCALFGAPHPQVHFRMFGPERNPDFCITCLRGEYYGETSVVGRNYLTRQAATLLKFARSWSRRRPISSPRSMRPCRRRIRVPWRRMSNAQPDFFKAASIGGLFYSLVEKHRCRNSRFRVANGTAPARGRAGASENESNQNRVTSTKY